MYRDAPSFGITAERALTEAGALDPKHDKLLQHSEVDAEWVLVDIELGDASGARVRTKQAACNVPLSVGNAVLKCAPVERVDAAALPECAVQTIERCSRQFAKNGTTVVALGADVSRERVVQAVIRRGWRRRNVWVGTSPVRLIATLRYRSVSQRTKYRLGAGAAAVLTLAPAVAAVIAAPVTARLLVYAVPTALLFARAAWLGPRSSYAEDSVLPDWSALAKR